MLLFLSHPNERWMDTGKVFFMGYLGAGVHLSVKAFPLSPADIRSHV